MKLTPNAIFWYNQHIQFSRVAGNDSIEEI